MRLRFAAAQNACGSKVAFPIWLFVDCIPSPRSRRSATGELVPVVCPFLRKPRSSESASRRQQ